MSTNDTQDKETVESRHRNDDGCPICGQSVDDVTELSERRRQGDIEDVPGRAYDHSGTGAGACFEWADGETSSSKL
ncbi:hypothetical protein [Haloarcula onubensis]|uniref:Small CPxCG-related zinc finger protein n=1 Tax=Haloarcula onubensis TaxID=2950539 RepID=A0ABU2FWZ4_9EURY|nr:hypothetical protein [Halomicroarcula sp. S3CR25-11]MDS0284771.1 hypothetical protein [Halomicroarcula sp. S3CR25-11]